MILTLEFVPTFFLDGFVPCSHSYGVYILQLICFAIVCSYADEFNNRNTDVTSKLLKQDYRHHKHHQTLDTIRHFLNFFPGIQS